MTTMVERMAKAAWADLSCLGSFEEYEQRQGFEETEAENREAYATRLADWPDSNMIHPTPDAFRSAARAALTALLEPSEGMSSAGADHLFASSNDNWSLDAREVFTAMIQAALDEREG